MKITLSSPGLHQLMLLYLIIYLCWIKKFNDQDRQCVVTLSEPQPWAQRRGSEGSLLSQYALSWYLPCPGLSPWAKRRVSLKGACCVLQSGLLRCHPERSEGSLSMGREMLPLRYAQGFGSYAQHDRTGFGC